MQTSILFSKSDFHTSIVTCWT